MINKTDQNFTSSPKLYEIIHQSIRENIEKGTVPEGSLLQEKTLATMFEVSRAPVNMALGILQEEGFVTHLASRGYVVGKLPPGVDEEMIQRSPTLIISPDTASALKARSTWRRIHDDVERVIAFALPFGCYQINETKMAAYYGVSRTVIREVMGRLEQWGMIEKHRQAHWRAGPLSKKKMTDLYQVRRYLEPPTLEMVAPKLDRNFLLQMEERIEEALADDVVLTIEQIDNIESDLHGRCLSHCDNPILLRMLQQSQLALITTSYLFQRYLKIPKGESFISEHCLVVKLLLQGSGKAAAAALDAHLEASCRVSLDRLQKLSSMKEPETPPFLIKVDEN
ncbi:MAG: GntR family transcriptional regulator, partial [Candidatus Sumerlaeia bacterium]|nr:GntR family transcriptional regulator [Candidatus Sumerlaeia bacterium]